MWIWVVYPNAEKSSLVASGIADDGDRARFLVEAVLDIAPEHCLGLVISPDFLHTGCRRAHDGRGFTWFQLG